MKAYSREQTSVILCILIVLFPLAFGKLYRLCKENRVTCSTAPAAVYELRGEGIEEGYYCFNAEQTARSLLPAAGGVRSGQSLSGNALLPDDVPLKSGTRIIFRAGGAEFPGFYAADMDAASRLNFFMPVSLHTATVQDLMLIPGIGNKTAAAIIEYRTAHQKINTIEELHDIPGFGEKKLQAVAPYLTTE